ncbi:MAG: transcription elongation factor GreA [Alphaproteobacteria bacterium]|nr:transcription elongation factor GreA [Rickettsiales bacterium]
MFTNTKQAISLEGIKKLEKNLQALHEEREEAVRAVSAGREHGDLKENAEYQSAKEWQHKVESKIASLGSFIRNSEIIDISKLLPNGIVKFGSIVGLKMYDPDKTMKIQILGEKESNFEKQQISISSPLAKALIGKSANWYGKLKNKITKIFNNWRFGIKIAINKQCLFAIFVRHSIA